MYLSVSHSPARFHWWHCSSSRMMCSVACLLVLSFASLLVNSASGFGAATTGSLSGRCCATAGVAASTASVAAVASSAFIGTSSRYAALPCMMRCAPPFVHRLPLLHRSKAPMCAPETPPFPKA
jgi:hypothetical protein